MGQPGIDFPGFGTGLAIMRGRSVLLYKRIKAPEPGHWNIVGGKVDHMERSSLAAKREAEEETGLKIGDIRFLCLSEQIIPEDGHHWISTIYTTDDFTGEPRVIEPEKLPEFGWFDLDDLPTPLSRFAADAVKALQATA
ncbi:NUDIX domain-containing protein [Rhizobium sp. L1K21]|uniref:NUDIX domain-containing protein n=1 Tax=Rhizobium sp. L1K21 TaxID=2954933 RepID=UPI0020935CAE|nr:NUDIX domain-containing protein [Rhizobium sp. L1K21]MCO6185899.1 NUDIX domain-containing protein [Rhizobium sp. L1K21]